MATILHTWHPQLEEWMRRGAIVVVAQTPGLVERLLRVIDPGTGDVVVVDSFTAGKRQLMLKPRLLITELRLGEYNGLHLALRAQAQAVPTVVIGDADPVLQRDAAAMGATYVTVDGPIADRIQALLPLTRGLPPTTPARDVAWGAYSAHAPWDPASAWHTVLETPATTH
jgi:hypothetical protein